MHQPLTRREMLRQTAALAALALTQTPLSALGLDAMAKGEVIPFLDKQAGKNGITWQDLMTWMTPSDQLYEVQHYGVPKIDLAAWTLELGGLVRHPLTFTLDELKARKRKTITADRKSVV